MQQISLQHRLSGQTSIGGVRRYMDLVGCVLVTVAVGRGAPWPASSSLRRPYPLESNTLWRGWVYRLVPGAPVKGNANGARGIFEAPSIAAIRPCARSLLRKDLLPHSSGWRDGRRIPTQPSRCDNVYYDRLQSSVLASTRIWSGQYTDLVSTRIWFGGRRSRCTLTGILEPPGAAHPGFNSPRWG